MIPGFSQLLLVCGLVFVVILVVLGTMLRFLRRDAE